LSGLNRREDGVEAGLREITARLRRENRCEERRGDEADRKRPARGARGTRRKAERRCRADAGNEAGAFDLTPTWLRRLR
jgi:hypothetical protein